MIRFFLATCFAIAACAGSRAEPVDVELVLAADGSGSIDADELALQRDGWASALESAEVQDAIRQGYLGRIAIVYVEWGGPTSQHVVVDWHVISDAASAEVFGAKLRASPRAAHGYNSISAAIQFGMALVDANAHQGARKVIDVSGDGPNIGGPDILATREAALAAGFTINALAIKRPGGAIRSFDGRPLEQYYATSVIGGPGAFVEIADEKRPFAEAARRKLLQEVAATSAGTFAAR